MSKLNRAANRSLLLLALTLGAPAVLSSQQPAPDTAAHAHHELSAEQRAQYVGDYQVDTPDGPISIRIYEQGESLMGKPDTADEPSPLVPMGEHRFQPVLAEGAVMTFIVENGRAASFSIAFPDERGTMTAVRKP